MVEHEYLSIFDKLFNEHYSSLWKHAIRIVGSGEAAEDIVQDCFFELWQSRHSIDFSGPLGGYLFKSISNRSFNYIKSKACSAKVKLSDYEQKNQEELLHVVIEQEVQFDYKELANELRCGINHLPEQCRKIFILSRTHGLKNKEIAEKLAISVKAVEKQITRALKELRAHLKKNEFIPLLFLLVSIA